MLVHCTLYRPPPSHSPGRGMTPYSKLVIKGLNPDMSVQIPSFSPARQGDDSMGLFIKGGNLELGVASFLAPTRYFVIF